MITKKIIDSKRVRHIKGGFSFIPHRFLTDGFFQALSQRELLLYLFLVLASDRYGLSYYAYDKICLLLQFTVEDYIEARNSLLQKDLIAFDGTLYQVLDLPANPFTAANQKENQEAIAHLINQSFKEVDYAG